MLQKTKQKQQKLMSSYFQVPLHSFPFRDALLRVLWGSWTWIGLGTLAGPVHRFHRCWCINEVLSAWAASKEPQCTPVVARWSCCTVAQESGGTRSWCQWPQLRQRQHGPRLVHGTSTLETFCRRLVLFCPNMIWNIQQVLYLLSATSIKSLFSS